MCAVLGTPIQAIRETEDRDLFVRKLAEIGVKTPRSAAATRLRTPSERPATSAIR